MHRGVVADDAYCNGDAERARECNLISCEEYHRQNAKRMAHWEVGTWEEVNERDSLATTNGMFLQCTVSCGDGWQRRRVLCRPMEGLCDIGTKPDGRRPCRQKSCPLILLSSKEKN